MDWPIIFKINEGENTMKKGKCNVCSKVFTAKKNVSIVGRLGPIPVDLCKGCLPKVLKHDELTLNDTRR